MQASNVRMSMDDTRRNCLRHILEHIALIPELDNVVKTPSLFSKSDQRFACMSSLPCDNLVCRERNDLKVYGSRESACPKIISRRKEWRARQSKTSSRIAIEIRHLHSHDIIHRDFTLEGHGTVLTRTMKRTIFVLFP